MAFENAIVQSIKQKAKEKFEKKLYKKVNVWLSRRMHSKFYFVLEKTQPISKHTYCRD